MKKVKIFELFEACGEIKDINGTPYRVIDGSLKYNMFRAAPENIDEKCFHESIYNNPGLPIGIVDGKMRLDAFSESFGFIPDVKFLSE